MYYVIFCFQFIWGVAYFRQFGASEVMWHAISRMMRFLCQGYKRGLLLLTAVWQSQEKICSTSNVTKIGVERRSAVRCMMIRFPALPFNKAGLILGRAPFQIISCQTDLFWALKNTIILGVHLLFQRRKNRIYMLVHSSTWRFKRGKKSHGNKKVSFINNVSTFVKQWQKAINSFFCVCVATWQKSSNHCCMCPM